MCRNSSLQRIFSGELEQDEYNPAVECDEEFQYCCIALVSRCCSVALIVLVFLDHRHQQRHGTWRVRSCGLRSVAFWYLAVSGSRLDGVNINLRYQGDVELSRYRCSISRPSQETWAGLVLPYCMEWFCVRCVVVLVSASCISLTRDSDENQHATAVRSKRQVLHSPFRQPLRDPKRQLEQDIACCVRKNYLSRSAGFST